MILQTKGSANEFPPKAIPKPVRDVLNDYEDVFSEDFTSGLPSKGAHEFPVELEADSKPQGNGPVYKSLVELDENQNQIDELLKKPFI